MTVTCHSELVAVEGRKLTFKVTLADEKGPVGGGTHERFIIFEEKFAAKAEAKKGDQRVLHADTESNDLCFFIDIDGDALA